MQIRIARCAGVQRSVVLLVLLAIGGIGRRAVRGDRVLCNTAHRRDRCSNGARRTTEPGAVARPPARLGAARDRRADRRRWHVRRGKLLESLLIQTSTRDPMTIGSITALMIAVSIAACVWPARRAIQLNPVSALRYE